MASPKPARTQPASQAGGVKRDRGTRGGRPEPQPRGGRPAGKPASQPARPARPAQAGTRATAEAAAPVTRMAPLWVQLTSWVLAFGGLGVSIYLTVAHYTSSSILACSDKGLVNCAEVTTSPESMVFGVFPVAVLGLAFYVFMVAATSPWAWRSKYPAVAWARVASLVAGIVFVLYLVYSELFTIKAICLWCTSVHVITFLLFVLIMISAAVGYGFRDPDAAR